MKFHILKSEIKWKSIENEHLLINKLFYKQNGEKKIISSFKKNFQNIDEHQIVEILSKNIYTKHNSYLLFYHWYERKYGINIIEGDNAILKTPIIENSIVSNVYTRNKKLHNQLREFVIVNLSSNRFDGFSVFYEYLFNYFPNIEKFDLDQLIGEEFLIYILELFPHIKQVIHDNGSYFRYTSKSLPKPEYLFDNEYGINVLRYNKGLPSFYPTIPEKYNIDNQTTYPLNLMKRNLKELEDVIRENNGLPKIGEGWIAETTLYYELKTHFKEEEVQHHGQPKWLGLQHIDIWFPSYNIGIEYQGVQHDRPVEFFGGEESFIKNQERDKKKKMLFKENNSFLIEVRPNYDLYEVIKIIEERITNTIF